MFGFTFVLLVRDQICIAVSFMTQQLSQLTHTQIRCNWLPFNRSLKNMGPHEIDFVHIISMASAWQLCEPMLTVSIVSPLTVLNNPT